MMPASISRSLIVAEAEKRGWQVAYIGHDEYFCKITDDKGQSDIFLGSRPLKNSANSLTICIYKDLTLEYAQSLGYQVPAFVVVSEDGSQHASKFLANYQKVVIKPVDGQRSMGVTTSITDTSQLADAISLAISNSRSRRAMVQQQVEGKLYRLFIIDGELVAASHRRAPQVVGDGEHSIRELIAVLNLDPRRGEDNDKPLKKILLSDAEAFLGKEGLDIVPSLGEVVKVSILDSVSAGGEAIDVTAVVHDDWKRVAAHLANEVNLFVCGYDVICEDISKPLEGNFLPLLEINSSPGLKIHHYPTGGGEPVDVASILLDKVFGIAKN
jgi:cyanophycin synthetase